VDAPLTWQTALTVWDMPIVVAVVLCLAAVGYLVAAGCARHWPVHHTIWFLAGLAVIAVAAGSAVNAYSHVLFSMHMAQHLLLIMVAPACLVLGRPLQLVRDTAGRRTRSALGGIARTRAVAVLTHPAAAFVLYTAVVVGTHLTPFQQSALLRPWLHGVEELLYLISGYLLLVPILGGEPIGRSLSHLLRLVLLLAGMVVDTVVGVTLLLTPDEPFPAYAALGRTWGPGLVEDLHWGGAIMWVGGDLLMVALAIAVITRWVNSPGGGNDLGPWLDAARRSAIGGDELKHDVDMDDDEEALRAYNAMLSRLAGRDGEPPP
jgi:putative copper resistance protein D